MTPPPAGPRPRFYQEDALSAVREKLREHRSTLVEMPTGSGKSVLFSQLASEWDGRVLVLAHRKELIQQARDHLERATGLFVDVEMAHQQSYSSRIVVGSVQSVSQTRRLYRLGSKAFDLIIIDEAHRAASKSYQKIMDFFSTSKVLMVTATPDRSDKRGLGVDEDAVAYRMNIEQGIEWGYLCNIEAERIFLGEIDLSAVKTTAGDLQVGQLDEAVAKAVAGVVHETLKRVPEKQGIAFFPGVRSALLAAERFNSKRPGCAEFVCGETPDEERASIIRRFRAGQFQFLCNVGVATEGFDHPGVEVIILARPTKSRGLYSQMVGRGTRPDPESGINDVHGIEGSERRRELVKNSRKPSCLILDFYGNAGHHSLCSPLDLLAGNYSKKVLEAAKKIESKLGGQVDIRDRIALAREALRVLAKQRAEVRARSAKVGSKSLFRGGGAAPDERPGRDVELATEGQVRMLARSGVKNPQLLSKREAHKRITSIIAAKEQARAEMVHIRMIGAFGVSIPVTITPATAKKAVAYIMEQRRRGHAVDKLTLDHIVRKGLQ